MDEALNLTLSKQAARVAQALLDVDHLLSRLQLLEQENEQLKSELTASAEEPAYSFEAE